VGLKFYILTSESIQALKRHFAPDFSAIPVEQAVVIINTLDANYERKAVEYCREQGIEHHVTVSNGTPARGKNSVMEVFLSSDNDYCVLVDGDDFLTKHGVWMYNHLATTDTPPDAVCLVSQFSYRRYGEGGVIACNPFTLDYDKELSIDLYKEFKNTRAIGHKKAAHFARLHKSYYKNQRKYSEGNEVHCRVTWFSRKAATFKFDESIRIGEDTLHMLRLKHEAIKNGLRFYSTDERPATYVYDECTYGIVARDSKLGTDYGWMDTYLVALGRMKKKGQLHANTLLPELRIHYPSDLAYDDIAIDTSFVHKLPECDFGFPKNATEESVRNAYSFLLKNALLRKREAA